MREVGTSAGLQWPLWTERRSQKSLAVTLTTARLLLGRAGGEEHQRTDRRDILQPELRDTKKGDSETPS